jgi:hypothetical protein
VVGGGCWVEGGGENERARYMYTEDHFSDFVVTAD